MEMMVWEKPEMNEVVFAANESVSACTYNCSINGAKGWFMLEANHNGTADFVEGHSTRTRETFGGTYQTYFEEMTRKSQQAWEVDLLLFNEADYLQYDPCDGHESGSGSVNTSEAVQGWYIADTFTQNQWSDSSLWQRAWLWLENNVLHAAIEGRDFERNRS